MNYTKSITIPSTRCELSEHAETTDASSKYNLHCNSKHYELRYFTSNPDRFNIGDIVKVRIIHVIYNVLMLRYQQLDRNEWNFTAPLKRKGQITEGLFVVNDNSDGMIDMTSSGQLTHTIN